MNKSFELSLAKESQLNELVLEALHWMPERSPEERMKVRGEVIAWIEDISSKAVSNGMVDEWFAGAGPDVKKVAEGVHGPVFEFLAQLVGATDRDGVFLSGTVRRS